MELGEGSRGSVNVTLVTEPGNWLCKQQIFTGHISFQNEESGTPATEALIHCYP